MNRHLFHFSYYNFLWRDDMHGNFSEFISSDPGVVAIKREVRFLFLLVKGVHILTFMILLYANNDLYIL